MIAKGRPSRVLPAAFALFVASCFFSLDDVRTRDAGADGGAPDDGGVRDAVTKDVITAGGPCNPNGGPPTNGACTCSGVCDAITCDNGGCDVTCASGSVCTADCKGGSCDFLCQGSATCTFDCPGGGCTFHCPPDSVTCKTTCTGANCTAVWP